MFLSLSPFTYSPALIGCIHRVVYVRYILFFQCNMYAIIEMFPSMYVTACVMVVMFRQHVNLSVVGPKDSHMYSAELIAKTLKNMCYFSV